MSLCMDVCGSNIWSGFPWLIQVTVHLFCLLIIPRQVWKEPTIFKMEKGRSTWLPYVSSTTGKDKKRDSPSTSTFHSSMALKGELIREMDLAPNKKRKPEFLLLALWTSLWGDPGRASICQKQSLLCGIVSDVEDCYKEIIKAFQH